MLKASIRMLALNAEQSSALDGVSSAPHASARTGPCWAALAVVASMNVSTVAFAQGASSTQDIRDALFGQSQGAAVPSLPSPAAPSSASSESLAMRVWTVTLNTAPDQSLFCEVAMRGRNREAGGSYSIRFRYERNAAPMLIITYAAPRLQSGGDVSVILDGLSLGELKARPSRLDRDDALVATVDTSWFGATVLPKFLSPNALGLSLIAGGRSFQAPVQGWAAVAENLDACLPRLAK